MRLTAGLIVAVAAVLAGDIPPVQAQEKAAALSVLTQNQYFGGDLIAVGKSPDLPSFLEAARAVLQDIAHNDFPARAQAFARQVAERRPDVIALQEVADFKLNGQNGPPPFVEQLTATLQALQAAGEYYDVVASVRNLHITLPVDLDANGSLESLVSVTDRDVILARHDLVAAGLVSAVPLSSVCPRPSADHGPGCNYSYYAKANTPLGAIAFERGFVAVDVQADDRIYRVVNTHLEVENLDPANPLSPLIQSAQATELKTIVDAVSAGKSVVIVGDLNSTPDDARFPDPFNGPFVRPAPQLAAGVDYMNRPSAGGAYHEIWPLRPGNPAGFTCCLTSLTVPYFYAWERKDLVFSRDLPATVKANIVGNDTADKTPSGLWPSDHAGVWVRFWF